MAPTLKIPATIKESDEDSMEVDEPQVRLKSSDGKRFTLTKSEASCSNALRRMIESYQNASTEYINLQSVNSQMLSKVIEWCQVHCHDNSSENDNAIYTQKSHLQPDWDKTFFASLNEEELFKLMHVSNYLDVRGLFDSCCRVMAKRWEGKKVEEIRKMYNIQADFTPEEEHQLLLESKRLGMDN